MAGSSAPPSDSNPLAAGSSGASKYLADLPSRGLFSSTVLSSNPGYLKLAPYRMGGTCYCYWAAKHHHAVEKLNHMDCAKVGDYGCRPINHCWVSCNYVQVYGVGPNIAPPYTGIENITDATMPQGGMRVYICDHDTAPPDDQLIKTNQTNILIRSLTLKKQKGDSSSKDIKGASPSEASRKRPAERALDGRASAKRGVTNNQAGSRQEGSRSRVPEKDFQSLTVEKLRALLKEKGLSVKGKKDELIARLKGANSQS